MSILKTLMNRLAAANSDEAHGELLAKARQLMSYAGIGNNLYSIASDSANVGDSVIASCSIYIKSSIHFNYADVVSSLNRIHNDGIEIQFMAEKPGVLKITLIQTI